MKIVSKELIKDLLAGAEGQRVPFLGGPKPNELTEGLDYFEQRFQEFLDALSKVDFQYTAPHEEPVSAFSEVEFIEEEEDMVYKKDHIYDTASLEVYGLGNQVVLQRYFENMATRPQKISTGIPQLDEILGGGYRVGINTIGGVPGVGKTSLLMHSAVEMSKMGTAAIYLTHDMRSNELMDKVFSKISYDKYGAAGYTLTDICYRRILLDESQKSQLVIAEVMQQTKLLTIIDMLDTKEFIQYTSQYEDLQSLNVVERAIKMYSAIYKSPVFFIDSLQQMATYLGVGAKDSIDKLLMIFKELSAKYKACIVIVSTLSRQYYGKDLVIEAFKESGNIEYDSDSILTIQPKFLKEYADIVTMDDFKSCDYRDVTLKCLKSRDSGFKSCDLTLYAPYCSFIPYDQESRAAERNKAIKNTLIDNEATTEEKPVKASRPSKPKPVNEGFEMVD